MPGVKLGFDLLGVSRFMLLLDGMKDALGDFSPFWGQAAPDFYAAMEKQFASEGAAYGSPWAALEASYAAWKSGHGYPSSILQRSRAMKGSLTGGAGGFLKTGRQAMKIGTEVTGNQGQTYALFHQKGTSRMPARPLITEAMAKELGEQWGKKAHLFLFGMLGKR